MRAQVLFSILAGGLCCVACAGPAAGSLVAKAPTPPKEVLMELPALEGRGFSLEQGRSVGDRKVHEFRGTLQAKPLQLTEEVLAKAGNELALEYTLCQLIGGRIQACPQRVRVYLSLPSERVQRVERFDGQSFVPGSKADYEQLLAQTLLVSERNLGVIQEERSVCLIGTTEVACKKTRYAILLQGKKAELTITRGSEGDLSGEVRALDGTVLYHSELVELSRVRGASLAGSGSGQARLTKAP